MTFRMSEQSRTIKIYNLLTGTNEFIGEGDASFHLIQVCLQTVPILPRQIFRLASWPFSTVMRHRGISLKTIGVKRFMTWHQGTRYLFLNSVHYRKMLHGCRRMESIRSGTAHLG